MGWRDGECNAVITSGIINIERGFCLNSWVHVDYGGAGQGFGGYVLGGAPDSKAGNPHGRNYAAEWIIGVMRAAGVEDWAKLPGRAIRVRIDNGQIVAIGHIIKNDLWFCPRDLWSPTPTTGDSDE